MNTDKKTKKRQRSSSPQSPNERKIPFLKTVTAKMTELLPTKIANWFSLSSTSSSTNGSAIICDVTDSSSDDETESVPLVEQPPKKRRRFHLSSKYIYPDHEEANCVSNEASHSTETYLSINASQNATYSLPFAPLTAPSQSSSEALISKPNDSELISRGFSIQDPVRKRKSLFDTKHSKSSTSTTRISDTFVDPKRPCFKPALLGSPFYPGRTSYGGAASQYINKPNITQRQNPQVNELHGNESTMSQSARQVMELLDEYSSPIREARRIPQYTRNLSCDSSALCISGNKDNMSPYIKQNLQVASVASILRLKGKVRLLNTTNAARQIIASHSSATEINTRTGPTNSFSKRDSEKSLQESKEKDNDSTDEIISSETPKTTNPWSMGTPNSTSLWPKDNSNLKTNDTTANLSLPPCNTKSSSSNISNLQPCAISTPKVQKNTPKIVVPNSKSEIVTTPMSKQNSSTSTGYSNVEYKFATPITVGSGESPLTGSTPPKFLFDSPKCGMGSSKEQKEDEAIFTEASKADNQNIEKTMPKDWECADCWIKNKPDIDKCVCCGGKKPSSKAGNKYVLCSVCKLVNSQSHTDKCINCEKLPSNPTCNDKAISKSNKSSKWQCGDCWVDNDMKNDTCVCCGYKNSKKPLVSEADWTCDDCWIKNKSSVDKCAACGGAKLGAKQNTTTPSTNVSTLKTTDSIFQKIVSAQQSLWECSNCLVKNNSDVVKCVCCETEKPGTVKEKANSFNFGTNISGFKFGIDPKEVKADVAKQPEILQAKKDNQSEASETNNNVLPKTPTFTFGLPKKIKDQTDTSKNLGFTFGIPSAKQPSTETTVSPIFSAPTKPEDDKKEKFHEVPKVNLTVSEDKPANKPSSGGIFTIPLPQKSNPSLVVQPTISTVDTNLQNKEPTAPSLEPPAVTSSETTQNKNTFPGARIKLASNLFTKPAEPASTFPDKTSVYMFPETESSSRPSVFAKNDDSSTTLSLFKNPTSTTVTPLSDSSGPIFSFGVASSKPSASQQPEKIKYNFNFGNNNVANDNSFKFQFGPNAVNNSNSNQFSGGGITGNGLSTGSLASVTELPSNALPTGNDLQPGIPLQTGTSNIFGAPIQKENMWTQPQQQPQLSNTTPNLFGGNTAPNNNIQKSTFTFGATSTPFNAPAPVFGSNSAQQAPSIFGMQNQSTTPAPSLFSAPTQNQPTPGIFGNAQPSSAPAAPMGLFGSPSAVPAPAFGASNSGVPSFEATPLTTSTPAPSFNFGTSQSSLGVFGFGQQQPQQQPQQPASMYNFGAASGASPQTVQFNMGSAPNTAVRRVRKAVRRNPQR